MASRRLLPTVSHERLLFGSSRWFRGSQVRLARKANASINVGCGGVGFIGPGPMVAATAEKAILHERLANSEGDDR